MCKSHKPLCILHGSQQLKTQYAPHAHIKLNVFIVEHIYIYNIIPKQPMININCWNSTDRTW